MSAAELSYSEELVARLQATRVEYRATPWWRFNRRAELAAKGTVLARWLLVAEIAERAYGRRFLMPSSKARP